MPAPEKFPYDSMPWRLEHVDGARVGKAKAPTKVCFFHCEENALKYINRHKLKKTDYKLETAVPVEKPTTKRTRRPKSV
jgi:hypothetical protein